MLRKNDFDSDSCDSAEVDGDHRARKRRNKQAWDEDQASAPIEQPRPDSKVKIALSLYKVQQNIYLLDFQRVEVTISVIVQSSYYYAYDVMCWIFVVMTLWL